MSSGVFAQGIRPGEAEAAGLDRADKELLRGMGSNMASQMAGSGEGLEAVGNRADVLTRPLG